MAKWIWVAIGRLQIPPGRLQLALAQPFLPLNSWKFKDRLPPVRPDLCQGEGLGEAQGEGVQRLPQHEEAVLSDRFFSFSIWADFSKPASFGESRMKFTCFIYVFVLQNRRRFLDVISL